MLSQLITCQLEWSSAKTKHKATASTINDQFSLTRRHLTLFHSFQTYIWIQTLVKVWMFHFWIFIDNLTTCLNLHYYKNFNCISHVIPKQNTISLISNRPYHSYAHKSPNNILFFRQFHYIELLKMFICL